MNEMFCFQCEQTAGGKGCTKSGVCGKKPGTALLQDRLVGELVALSEKTKTPIDKLSDADVFAVCPKADKTWRGVFDLKRAFAMRENIGMPGPRQIAAQIAAWRELL